jgi:hypothetical protein
LQSLDVKRTTRPTKQDYTPVFTDWTDAQLNAGRRFADDSISGKALLQEIARREAAGIWLTDGSTERVADLIRSGRTNRSH